jgi:protein subunit release factor B
MLFHFNNNNHNKCNKMFRNSTFFKLFKPVNLNFITNLKSLKEPNYPPLIESELCEQIVKGSGPGGQSVNKTVNRCQLKHIPTGILVTCHQTRSLEENRKIARKMLQQQLDFYYNKENSYLAKLEKFKREQKAIKNKKSVENLKRKKEFKEQEDN